MALIGYGLRRFGLPRSPHRDDAWTAARGHRHGEPGTSGSGRRKHPHAHVFATPEQLWDEGGIDCVVIATLTPAAPLARAAISHGVAVVVDKPLAISPSKHSALSPRQNQGVLLTVFQEPTLGRRLHREVAHRVRLPWTGRPIRVPVRTVAPQIKGWLARTSPWLMAAALRPRVTCHRPGTDTVRLGGNRHAEVDTRRTDAKVDDDVFIALTHHNGVRSTLRARDRR